MQNGASQAAGTPEVAIVVPVLNERELIVDFYERVKQTGYGSALIFVDNASSDGTPELLEKLPGVHLIRHRRNLGYGASIRDGIAAASSRKVVIIDADLEYPPESIPELVAALDQDAVVYGSRFLSARPPDMPFLRQLGNRVVSSIFNMLFHQGTTDFYTGIKALRRDAIDRLNLTLDGFEQVVEMGVQLSRAGFRIREIPVAFNPRSRGTSKMRHLPEMLKYVWYVVRYRLRLDPRRARARAEAG
jgi:glycosyltransferase involved in cell wall biosynthesis